MNTEETIKEIEKQMQYHKSISKGMYAVLRPQSDYKDVDWAKVASYFNTDKIDGYSMTDKIIVQK